jgi:steroid delta-isomerase-like uncharacterized protein
MAAQDLIQKAREHLDTFNAKDWKRYRAGFTDDATYDEEATHRQATGADEIIKNVKQWVDAFPDLKGTEVSAYSSGDTAIMEIFWEGTHRGPLFGPMASIPPSGKKGKVSAVQVIRFEGGKVAEMRHYFDLLTVLQQIGVMPGAAAQPPAP